VSSEGGSRLKRGFRIAHVVVASLVLAGIVAQPFLIGLFLFGAVHNSDLHTEVGYGLFEGGIPLLLITGLLARLPKTEMLLTLLLMVDIFLQTRRSAPPPDGRWRSRSTKPACPWGRRP
jgi:hypothetical protein